eukprot:SAG25_NODE_14935_length_196_cov_90.907216_1_plen_55_part_10
MDKFNPKIDVCVGAWPLPACLLCAYILLDSMIRAKAVTDIPLRFYPFHVWFLTWN